MASSQTKTLQAIEQSRTNLTIFKQVLYRRYMRAAHLDILDRALMQVSRYVETQGESGIGRLIIEMPPRHGKSVTTSQYYPAWHLGRNPDHRMMLVSYGATLADRNSRIARNLLNLPHYRAMFPFVRLDRASRAVDTWNIEKAEGGADALGIDGGATGKGAHVLIIDDPVKNRADAESEIVRERTWSAFAADLYTRLEPNGAIIIMATRWHMDDLIGRALSLMPEEKFKRLRLPALAEANDPLGREIGEALWAKRFDARRLEKIRAALGEYDWMSLYQQSPIAPGQRLFDTDQIERLEVAPECREVVRFYDLAVTAKKKSDYTVGIKLGVTADETFVVLDVWRVRRELPDVHEGIVRNALDDGVNVPIRLEGEKAGIVELQFMLRDERLRGYTLDAEPPMGDKYTRAGPVASRAKAGRLKVLQREWTRAFLDELSVFPSGQHDDQVDALSGAYSMLTNAATVYQDTVPSELTDYRGI